MMPRPIESGTTSDQTQILLSMAYNGLIKQKIFFLNKTLAGRISQFEKNQAKKWKAKLI